MSNVLNAEAIFVRRRMARETEKLRKMAPRYTSGLFRSAKQARGYVDAMAAKYPVGEGGFTSPWIAAGDLIAMTYSIHTDMDQTDNLIIDIVKTIRSTGRNNDPCNLLAEINSYGPDTEITAKFEDVDAVITSYWLDKEEDVYHFIYDGEQYVPVQKG